MAKKGPSGEVNAYVDRETAIDGFIQVPDTLRIDGKVKGKIDAGREVVIAATADVDAEIEAEVVTITGKAAGIIRARERVEIFQTARVTSDVVTPSLRIDDGAVFQGRCEMAPKPAAPAVEEEPDKDKKNEERKNDE